MVSLDAGMGRVIVDGGWVDGEGRAAKGEGKRGRYCGEPPLALCLCLPALVAAHLSLPRKQPRKRVPQLGMGGANFGRTLHIPPQLHRRESADSLPDLTVMEEHHGLR